MGSARGGDTSFPHGVHGVHRHEALHERVGCLTAALQVAEQASLPHFTESPPHADDEVQLVTHEPSLEQARVAPLHAAGPSQCSEQS